MSSCSLPPGLVPLGIGAEEQHPVAVGVRRERGREARWHGHGEGFGALVASHASMMSLIAHAVKTTRLAPFVRPVTIAGLWRRGPRQGGTAVLERRMARTRSNRRRSRAARHRRQRGTYASATRALSHDGDRRRGAARGGGGGRRLGGNRAPGAQAQHQRYEHRVHRPGAELRLPRLAAGDDDVRAAPVVPRQVGRRGSEARPRGREGLPAREQQRTHLHVPRPPRLPVLRRHHGHRRELPARDRACSQPEDAVARRVVLGRHPRGGRGAGRQGDDAVGREGQRRPAHDHSDAPGARLPLPYRDAVLLRDPGEPADRLARGHERPRRRPVLLRRVQPPLVGAPAAESLLRRHPAPALGPGDGDPERRRADELPAGSPR